MAESTTIEKKFWESKKWWAMALTLIVTTVAAAFGIDLPIASIVAGGMGVVAFILGQAHVDAKTRAAKIAGDAALKLSGK